MKRLSSKLSNQIFEKNKNENVDDFRFLDVFFVVVAVPSLVLRNPC